VNAAWAGLAAGFSLIIAIGAQNAFVIRQGLARNQVGIVVLICALSDALLIAAGVGGLGAIIQALPWLLAVLRWGGVAYLTWFGIKTLRAVFKSEQLDSDGAPAALTLRQAVITCLMMTWLNPHVYLDTVIFLGSIANQFAVAKWWFAFGAASASVIWFTGIGYGAKAASRLLSKPVFWKVLDSVIAAMMFALAGLLAFAKL
jgi:L-lysine exporter family protein LysE/ArgO